MRRMMFIAMVGLGCSKEPSAMGPDAAPAEAPPKAAIPSAVPEASSTPPPPEVEQSPAMVVCKKLAAAGAVADCRISGNSARFGDEATDGVVSAFEDMKSFKAISSAMAKDQGKKTVTSEKARVLVMWKTESSAVSEKKIRDAVAAL